MPQRLLLEGTVQGFESLPPQYFFVLARGNFREPGEVVTARGFKCLAELPADWGLPPNAPESQRRLRLAQWIADARNPVSPRVIVNRLWHYHFGQGLVDTPGDFGFNGGRPSHPELLDYLADELVRHGWSLKHVQRQILLSATYRRSGQADPRGMQIDVQNRLLWRKSPLRLDAEAVRDTVLAVSGQLNPRMGGPSFHDLQVSTVVDNVAYTPTDTFDATVNRRTIYRTVARTATPAFLETLDCADPTVSTPRRSVTTTPMQALALLNNPLMVRSAAAFAARLQREAAQSVERQIDRAYQLALGRAATPEDLRRGATFVGQFGLADFCLVLLNSNELLIVD